MYKDCRVVWFSKICRESTPYPVYTGGCKKYIRRSVPTDAIEYNFSDSEEPSITIRKKEYQWTWYDRVENLGKDQALEDYDEIEKVVLTIPKE